MTAGDIRDYLKSVMCRPPTPSVETVREALASLKCSAVRTGDQHAAKTMWYLERVLSAQDHYLRAFSDIKAQRFFEAWCELEKTEGDLTALQCHDTRFWHECRLDFIHTYTAKWQSLFPYKIFLSPELLVTEMVCSVCGQRVLPRTFCGHRPGEIYDGEMCVAEVTKMDVLGLAMVEKPVQKYSVPFLRDERTDKHVDHYDYTVVRYLSGALQGPFDGWSAERTHRRQSHSRFSDVGRNDPCPCESGKKYKACCLREAGVLRPHIEFSLEVQPPDGTSLEMYVGSRHTDRRL